MASKFIEFELLNPRRNGFTIPAEFTDEHGVKHVSPLTYPKHNALTGQQVMTPRGYIWPKQSVVRLNKLQDKDLIKYLMACSLCGEKGWYRVKDNAKVASTKLARRKAQEAARTAAKKIVSFSTVGVPKVHNKNQLDAIYFKITKTQPGSISVEEKAEAIWAYAEGQPVSFVEMIGSKDIEADLFLSELKLKGIVTRKGFQHMYGDAHIGNEVQFRAKYRSMEPSDVNLITTLRDELFVILEREEKEAKAIEEASQLS